MRVITPAELRERAESYRMGGPSSEHTAKMLDDAADRIDALLADNARMRVVLGNIETACERLAGKRSQQTYESILADGCTDELIALDDARNAARQALHGRADKEMEAARSQPGSDAQERSPVPPLSDEGRG